MAAQCYTCRRPLKPPEGSGTERRRAVVAAAAVEYAATPPFALPQSVVTVGQSAGGRGRLGERYLAPRPALSRMPPPATSAQFSGASRGASFVATAAGSDRCCARCPCSS